MTEPTTDLVSLRESLGQTALSTVDDATFNAANKSIGFLPRLQLMTSNSEECKKGNFPINNFALIQDQSYQDIGKEVDIVVLSLRSKAMEFGDEVNVCYDPQLDADGNATGEFARIQQLAEAGGQGAMYGVEYLVWIPAQDKFATFFLGTASLRRESGKLRALLLKAASLRPKLIETKKYKWWSVDILSCSTPLEAPSIARAEKEIAAFLNPKVAPQGEAIKEESSDSERAR